MWPVKLGWFRNLLLIVAGSCSALAQPQLAWQARYNGPFNSFDGASFIAVDGMGNVFVSGDSTSAPYNSDFATVKYDRNGTQLWVRRFDGPRNKSDSVQALVVDRAGNAYIAGSSDGLSDGDDSQRYTTIRYDPGGTQLWAAHHDGVLNLLTKNNLAVDNLGNVYVAISGSDSNAQRALITIKYDSEGKMKWKAFYNAQGDFLSFSSGLALDEPGNVYVVASSFQGVSPKSRWDFVTVKYDGEGRELWASRYNGPENNDDLPSALAVDSQGNVYVAGDSVGSGTDNDCALVKYAPDGKELWVARYDGPNHGYDSLFRMLVDQLGNAYLTIISAVSFEQFRVVIKYNPDGTRAWLIRDQKGTLFPALDGDGNLYLCGASSDPITQSDYVTEKYDSKGRQLWLQRIRSPGGDTPTAITVDPSGNVYLTGYSDMGNGENENFFTAKHLQLPPPDTRLSSPALATNGPFQFFLQAETNRNYTIQYSSNLVQWRPLITLTVRTNPASIKDPASSTKRFYRALKLPQE